jgi:pimeloyl-ACP methyl ester carboxylesterase
MRKNATPITPDADLVFDRRTLSGIPVLSCFRKTTHRLPLVILSHGFTVSKETWTENLASLAGMGFHAVALDNRCHGERKGSGFNSQVYADGRLIILEVRRLIKETADDISILIDHYTKDERIDADRIGLAGVSMGGFVTFKALANDTRIKAAAPIIASPHWDDIPAGINAFEEEDEDGRRRLEVYSNQHGPAIQMDRYYPRAILIQIGGIDNHYSGDRVIHFYNDLKVLYGPASNRLKLVVHEGAGHDFTPEMWRLAVKWFRKHLQS